MNNPSTCGNIIIESTVTKVTATKGKGDGTKFYDIGKGYDTYSNCGTVTINGTVKSGGYNLTDDEKTNGIKGDGTGDTGGSTEEEVEGVIPNELEVTISGTETVYTFTIDGTFLTATFNTDGSVKTISGNNTSFNNNLVTISNKTYQLAYASGNVNYDEIPTWQADGNDFKYAYGGVDTYLCKLSGVKSVDSVTINDSKVVTITVANLDNKNVTIDGDGYTLALASGITAPQYTDAHFTLTDTTATYKSDSNTAGYTLSADNKTINYIAAVEETDLFTITGVKSIEGLVLNDTIVTVSESSLNQSDVTISEGYTLALAEGIAAPVTTEAHLTLDGTTATYKSTSNTAGYTVVDNKIIYTAATVEIALFTLMDVSSIDGITINAEDKTVTVAASALIAGSNSTTFTELNNSGYSAQDSYLADLMT